MVNFSGLLGELGNLVDKFRVEAHSVLAGAGLPAELGKILDRFHAEAHALVTTVESQVSGDAATVVGQVEADADTVAHDVAADIGPEAGAPEAPAALDATPTATPNP